MLSNLRGTQLRWIYYKRFYKSNSYLIKQNLSVCVQNSFHVCQNISLITENVLLRSFPQIFPYNYTQIKLSKAVI